MNQKELFWISVTVFLTIVAWMIIDIYRVQIPSSIDTQAGTPLTHLQIDPKILQIIKNKNP